MKKFEALTYSTTSESFYFILDIKWFSWYPRNAIGISWNRLKKTLCDAKVLIQRLPTISTKTVISNKYITRFCVQNHIKYKSSVEKIYHLLQNSWENYHNRNHNPKRLPVCTASCYTDPDTDVHYIPPGRTVVGDIAVTPRFYLHSVRQQVLSDQMATKYFGCVNIEKVTVCK